MTVKIVHIDGNGAHVYRGSPDELVDTLPDTIMFEIYQARLMELEEWMDLGTAIVMTLEIVADHPKTRDYLAMSKVVERILVKDMIEYALDYESNYGDGYTIRNMSGDSIMIMEEE